MRVNPSIAALRGDRAPQRRAQAAMDAACRAWRTQPGAAEAMADLQIYGEGAELEECSHLAALFASGDTAQRLVGSLVDRLCQAMRDNPIGHPPFRHGFDGVASTLLLARSGRAQLLLQAREPGKQAYSCATFSDAQRHETVLSGEACARLVRIAGPVGETVTLRSTPIELRPGVRLSQVLSCECLLVGTVRTRLVTLRLMRSAARPDAGREYALEDGRLLHMSAGDLATSHRASMVALLGRMERADAAPVLAGIACGAQAASLRWQALRECLALDTQEGFAALCRVAQASSDPLAREAGALRAQLIETYPQLEQMEDALCPA